LTIELPQRITSSTRSTIFRINNPNRDLNSQETSRAINPAAVETGVSPAQSSEIEADREQPGLTTISQAFDG